MKNPKSFSCSNANFLWSDQTFCKISLLEFVSKRLWIEMTGFHTPIYFINESIILKNESFCVVCIITYVTVVLLCKDGSNTLHVILTCILLFTLFTQGFNCGKWFIGYNVSIDDGAESKFGTHKELIVLKSRDMSRDHFAKNRKLLTKWWPV